MFVKVIKLFIKCVVSFIINKYFPYVLTFRYFILWLCLICVWIVMVCLLPECLSTFPFRIEIFVDSVYLNILSRLTQWKIGKFRNCETFSMVASVYTYTQGKIYDGWGGRGGGANRGLNFMNLRGGCLED